MVNLKKFFIASLLVGLSSILYIDFYLENFKFSFAAVIFPFLLILYSKFNPILFGITSGFSLALTRAVFSYIFKQTFIETFIYSLPECVFYIVYGTVIYLGKRKNSKIYNKYLILICFFADLLSNLVELYIRLGDEYLFTIANMTNALALVAFLRATLVWIIFSGYKYNKILIVKEEHDKRYRALLNLISQLKSETYLMVRNMDYIEKVMANAYNLFTDIRENRNKNTWADKSLNIAKDIHEIKKEYEMAVLGIEKIVLNKSENEGMYFDEIMAILEDTLIKETMNTNKDISIKFDSNNNFYTTKHYYLISILRNLVINAIDSIEQIGKVDIFHTVENSEHIFIISDNGHGIKEEDMQYIFSPGYSTKIDYNTGQINRGLGLTIVKDIVEENLKGKMEVKSQQGIGSTFIILIPVKELEVVNK